MPIRVYDYLALEREFVTSREEISIRELCKRHGIDEPSSVHAQARKRDPKTGLNWYDKRDEFKQKQHLALVDRVSDARAKIAAKEAGLYEKAVEAIELLFDQLIADIQAKKVSLKPLELAQLIDRMNVLFNRPSTITEGRNLGLSVNADATPDQFKRILELTSGVAGRDLGAGAAGTTLPRAEGPRTN